MLTHWAVPLGTTYPLPRLLQFPGKFEGRHVNYRVTSVAGHVFSTDFPEEYQSWDAVDPADLFSLPVVKVGRPATLVDACCQSAMLYY